MLAGIAAGAETTSRDTPVVIGVAAIDLQNPWFVRMKESGDKAAEYYNATVVWQSAEANLERRSRL